MPRTKYGLQDSNRGELQQWYDTNQAGNVQITEDWARCSWFIPYLKGTCCELGTQTGGWTKILAKHCDRVVGIDLAAHNIIKTKELLRDLGLEQKVELHTGFAEDFQTDEKFDLVTMMEIIEHVPKDRELIDKYVEMLAPGGYLLASIPYEHKYAEEDHLNWYTIKDVQDLFIYRGYKCWISLVYEPDPMWFLIRLQKSKWE